MKPKNVDLIKLDDVPALIFEETGVKRCRATVYNWTVKGRLNYANEHVVLKSTKRLGQTFTTKKWLLEFIGGL